MLRLFLHCLLILALASAGSALPRHAHAAPAHEAHAIAMQGHPEGHGLHPASEAPDGDCCADQGCDCGCAVAPALGPTPLVSSPMTLVEPPAAPASGVPPAALHRPPLRPPAA